jgi:benzodiazapine receptor
MKIDWLRLILSIVIASLAGFIGSLFTMNSVRTWYQTIKRPDWNPPNWLFGPVWTLLYFLMGIALYLVWSKGTDTQYARMALLLFGIQLALNSVWSILFFGLHSPFWAFIEIAILWLFILLTMFSFYPISRAASYLMVPYILWVSFAAVLNFSIYWLNR